jgi:hypothetical protein
VGDGRCELDVAHALAAHLGQGDLDAALLADDALVLHPLVLAAQALVVLDRPENAGAEQPVALGLEGPVIDRLGLLDLAEGPRQDLLGRGDIDADLLERRSLGDRAENVHDLLVHQSINSLWRTFGPHSDCVALVFLAVPAGGDLWPPPAR